jgi:tRNA wybutosine-synthesizing protein 2
MFSSGNVDERMGIERIVTKGPRPPRVEGQGGDEIVIDMFAGIGYFSLPIARGCPVGKVYALEKNPTSFYYLERNIGLNGVTDKVAPIYGDNRKVHPPEKGDRIVMGYVGGTLEFVPRALELSAREGSILHLHDTVKVESGARELYTDARRIIEDGGLSSELLDWRRVKSYAPRIDHVVLDILVTS